MQIQEIPLTKIVFSKSNPRQEVNQESISDLALSIAKYGLLQPILVRPLKAGKSFEVVYGERRVRACRVAALETIKAEVRELDDETVFEIQILENLQRENISPLDEAKAFSSLMKKQNIDWLSSTINKPKKYVQDRIKLLDLCDFATSALKFGVLPLGHAMLLSKIDKADQERIMKNYRVISGYDPTAETADHFRAAICNVTRDNLKNYIKSETMLTFDRAIFDLEDEKLLPAVGSCAACVKRTINQQLLFSDITSEDRCTDSFCYKAKTDTQVQINIEKAKEDFGVPVLKAVQDPYSSHGVKLSGQKETVYVSETKNEVFSVPVVITKSDSYNTKLGRTVFVKPEDAEPKEKEKAQPKAQMSYREIEKKRFLNMILPRINFLLDKIFYETSLESAYTDEFFFKLVSNCDIHILYEIGKFLKLELPIADATYDLLNELDWSKTEQAKRDIAKLIIDNAPSNEFLMNLIVIDDVIKDHIDNDDSNYSENTWTINRYAAKLGLTDALVALEESSEQEAGVEKLNNDAE